MFKLNKKNIYFYRVFRYTNRSKFLTNGFILFFAFIGGTAATFSAINAMLNSDFSAPCYAEIFFSSFKANLEDLSAAIVPTNFTTSTFITT